MVWDFPHGPIVKNPSLKAGDTGWIPGQGTKIPQAAEQLSMRSTSTQLSQHKARSHVPQLRREAAQKKHTKQHTKS